MRYAVDCCAMRSRVDLGGRSGERDDELLIIGGLFVVFMVLGTFLFVRAERNR